MSDRLYGGPAIDETLMSLRRWRMILLAAPLVACASTASTATPERQAQIRAAADACLPTHPTVCAMT